MDAFFKKIIVVMRKFMCFLLFYCLFIVGCRSENDKMEDRNASKLVNIETKIKEGGCKDGISFDFNKALINKNYILNINEIKEFSDIKKKLSFSYESLKNQNQILKINLNEYGNKGFAITSRGLSFPSFQKVSLFKKNAFNIGIKSNFFRNNLDLKNLNVNELNNKTMNNLTLHTGHESDNPNSIYISTSTNSDISLHYSIGRQEKGKQFEININKINNIDYSTLVIIRNLPKTGFIIKEISKKTNDFKVGGHQNIEDELSRVGFIPSEDIAGIYTFIKINKKFFDYFYEKNPNFKFINDQNEVSKYKEKIDSKIKKFIGDCIKINLDKKIDNEIKTFIKSKKVDDDLRYIILETKNNVIGEIKINYEEYLKEDQEQSNDEYDEEDEIISFFQAFKDEKGFFRDISDVKKYHFINFFFEAENFFENNFIIFHYQDKVCKGYYRFIFKGDLHNKILIIRWIPIDKIFKPNYQGIAEIIKTFVKKEHNTKKIKEILIIEDNKIKSLN